MEKLIVFIGITGILLAGSDAIDPVWPWNCIMGALLLAVAGLIALTSRSASKR